MNLRFEEEAKKERHKKLIIETIRYVIEIILVIVLAWCVVNFALKKVTMIGSSMESTLNSGEEVIVNTFFNHFSAPGRGDVIAFYPEQGTADDSMRADNNILIRRVVGLPGETVRMEDGKVLINGEPIEEDYIFDRNVSAGQAEEDYKLEKDEFFVLSDKRSDLDDSRSASFTKVRRDNIVGSVFLALDPFSFVSGPKVTTDKETTEEDK